jgi:hypothetical protein
MICFQVVCGAANTCNSSLKAQIDAMGGLENTVKLNENALKSMKETLITVQRKEISSKFRWISQCINAARLREVLSLSHGHYFVSSSHLPGTLQYYLIKFTI